MIKFLLLKSGKDLIIFPLIKAGILNSLTPGALSAVLIFLVFLFFVLKRNYKIGHMGFYFIIGFAGLKIFLDLGVFDIILMSKGMDLFWDVVFFSIGLLSFIVGGVCLRDWIVYLKEEKFDRLLIRFRFLNGPDLDQGSQKNTLLSSGKKKFRGFFSLLMILFSLILGGFIAVLESAFAPDQMTILMMQQSIFSKTVLGALIMLLIYATALASPFILTLILVGKIIKTYSVLDYLKNFYSKVQIICAAVFFSFGVIILSYFM